MIPTTTAAAPKRPKGDLPDLLLLFPAFPITLMIRPNDDEVARTVCGNLHNCRLRVRGHGEIYTQIAFAVCLRMFCSLARPLKADFGMDGGKWCGVVQFANLRFDCIKLHLRRTGNLLSTQSA